MAIEDVRRRSSYGAASPAIGERGARTRKSIIDSALRCFEERGFEHTLVEDIALEAGISRATLYQYFENKEQLFVELVRESGADLIRVLRRLRPLSATKDGFENLHWWLSDWAWVYDRYSTVFVQWSNVDSPKAPLRPMIGQFIESFANRMVPQIRGVEGLEPYDLAVSMLALLVRFNYYRRTGVDRGLSDEELLDGLAVFLQMALFPSTTTAELTVQGESVAARTSLVGPPSPRRGEHAPLERVRPKYAGAGTRALATVRQLLDAAATVYADHGFLRSTVEDILTEAGLGRGTFYKYFSDKLEVLVILAQECRDRMEEVVHRFGEAVNRPEDLRAWLTEFVGLHKRYAGVLRAWTAREPSDPKVIHIGENAVSHMLETFDGVLGSVESRRPLDARIGSLLLLSLLERLPDYSVGTAYDMPDERTVEVLATLIERGLLGRTVSV